MKLKQGVLHSLLHECAQTRRKTFQGTSALALNKGHGRFNTRYCFLQQLSEGKGWRWRWEKLQRLAVVVVLALQAVVIANIGTILHYHVLTSAVSLLCCFLYEGRKLTELILTHWNLVPSGDNGVVFLRNTVICTRCASILIYRWLIHLTLARDQVRLIGRIYLCSENWAGIWIQN